MKGEKKYIYIFPRLTQAFRDTNLWFSCALKHMMWQRVFLGAREFKVWNFMCVGSLVGVTYLRYTVLKISNKSGTAVHCCDPALSVLVILVSQNVFHVVSALQFIVFIHFWGADQVCCRSYVGSAYHMRSLAVI